MAERGVIAGENGFWREFTAGKIFPLRIDQFPFYLGIRDRQRSEVGDFNFRLQFLGRGEHAFWQARERDGGIAETAVFRRRDIALVLPKRIKHADKRGSLAGKIM